MKFERLVQSWFRSRIGRRRAREDTPRRPFEPETYFGAELFNAERLERHGKYLARRHRLQPQPSSNRLLRRLAENTILLARAHDVLGHAGRAPEDPPPPPAAEWLLDNYYLIEEQAAAARLHLPKGFNRQLPQLADGHAAGLPRVYDLALELVARGDGRVDGDRLRPFVAAYQTVAPLDLGELWAVPIMLRLALIEKARGVAERLLAERADRGLAAKWAGRLVAMAEKDPKRVILVLAEMAAAPPRLTGAFVSEFARRLQGQGPALLQPLAWVEQCLAETGESVAQRVRRESQRQASDQVAVSNAVTSLRLLVNMDWHDFVEEMSVVERVLREDPAGAYASMDFVSRDRYRHEVERLAKRHGLPEEATARAALRQAWEAAVAVKHPRDCREAHIGFHLVDAGLPGLEAVLSAQSSAGPWTRGWRWIGRIPRRRPLAVYLSAFLAAVAAAAAPFVAWAHADGLAWPWFAALAAVAALAVSQTALAIVNGFASLVARPQLPPRMDFTGGIPATARTAVVVPALLSRPGDIDDLVERLEWRYLSNREPRLHFGLLTDFTDADTAETPVDAELLSRVREGIEALNAKYPGEDGERFFLCHRPRRWNPSEGVWMARERKRGKLEDFNDLLRDAGCDHFTLRVGELAVPSGALLARQVRYVVTLDVDTQLPGGTARQMVETLEHPLNRPVNDPDTGVVTAGHGILQPRVGTSLPSHGAGSPYAQLFGGDAGMDPYTRAVSDVYQDVFGEGSFVGKGIYHVDAVARALGGRFPENRVLSHDLIEGCYARSGLASDIQLYEEYPARYLVDMKRRHRWIRGDWQLLPWLCPRVPTASGREANPLSALSRWKLFDNLRRSLVPAALMALLFYGWAVSAHPVGWSLAVPALALLPAALSFARALLAKAADVTFVRHGTAEARGFTTRAGETLLGLAWLPFEAYHHLDAVARTLWNLFVTGRRLLRWEPSARNRRHGDERLSTVFRLMASGPAAGVLAVAALAAWRGESLSAWLAAAPFVLAWLAGPWMAWRLGRPAARADFAPDAEDRRFLRQLARRTWGFFDRHVGLEDNWLPPDNMQEHPVPAVAHRTSPTNMGLSLLAHLAARDFGYLPTEDLLERLDKSLSVMAVLPRHRGHFLNWYDTVTLQPLPPRYISTVDSGNLAGHLLTFRAGLLELVDEPVWDRRWRDGLADAVAALRDVAKDVDLDREPWRGFLDACDAAVADPDETPDAAHTRLGHLWSRAKTLSDGGADGDVGYWLDALARQCRDFARAAGQAAKLLPDASAAAPEPSGWTWRRLAGLDVSGLPENRREAAVRRRDRAAAVVARAERLAREAGRMAEMDFTFLYDARRDLFTIGYNLEENRPDAGYYDLLASEVRLADYVAVAQGQVPQKSWFALGRLLVGGEGDPVLLSWSGSMFEYLMPLLVMPTYPDTLLDLTCRAAVARQIALGRRRGTPWGVSESGYNAFDAHLNYQYRAFGCPGLGLQRGLGDEHVIAPYATMLALMVDPAAATRNLRRLADDGVAGRYGLHEAVDYTPSRVPRGHSSAVIRSYMAHHQGMGLLALANALLGNPMQRRFRSDPQLRAIEMLLQERSPKTMPEVPQAVRAALPGAAARDAVDDGLCVFTDPDRPHPPVQLLSNGNYHVMVTAAGGGYSRYRDRDVTRWREDPTRDAWGQFCYVRDVASGEYWSVGHQPVGRKLEGREAIFSDARAEFRLRPRDYDIHAEIAVCTEDDGELRRVTVANRGHGRRTVELTTYAEVVLAPSAADEQHPAFGNLFVETEIVESLQAILATRRPRSADEKPLWMFHMAAVHDAGLDDLSYETDRARFLGRNRDPSRPAAMEHDAGDGRLSGTAGPVLDPAVSLRGRVTLEPGQRVVFDFATGVGLTRDECLRMVQKYRDRLLADRVFALSWTRSQVQLRQLGISVVDARLYAELAAALLFANPRTRAAPDTLAANRRSQSGLWGHGISGDLPIVLLKVGDRDNPGLLRQLVQAHAYWRVKGLAADLVVLSEESAGYRRPLHDRIVSLVPPGSEPPAIDRPGGIFVRAAANVTQEDRTLLEAVARVVLDAGAGSLADQLVRRAEPPLPPEIRFTSRIRRPRRRPSPRLAPLEGGLLLPGPHGGFSASGEEYVVTLKSGETTPAPWSNVLANAGFGTVVTESGGAYTWSENAHEFRLTPWSNDPVTDVSGEAFYLRDEDTGRCWSPSPAPRRGRGEYRTRHGFGYTVFEHVEGGIHSELWTFVAVDAPVKVSLLKVRNLSGMPRRLSATAYAEWVLGGARSRTAMHVVTAFDAAVGAVYARNAYSAEFPGRTAFLACDGGDLSVTGDRREFLGRNGHPAAPAALARTRLSGRTGAGFDPCAALQTPFELADGGERELTFCLGAAADAQAAAEWLRRFRGPEAARDALDAVRGEWRRTLDAVRVETPDPAVDVLVNGWLPYQVAACRFRARSGYYQSGGAYGFRDQLQDVLALVHALPGAAREHILLCASRQFPEGDVQHWWHPPFNRGVRTACSDDFLWLPLAVARYVRVTGDVAILDEPAGYVEGRLLQPGEESVYDLPTRSALAEPLYRHCVRALEHGLDRRGPHGFPPMGAGDWNDGMNRVGEKGIGESVWLGFFQHEVLRQFAPLARGRGDAAFADRCLAAAAQLRDALDRHGWDGDWFRRAYFDDGTPLGSAANEECRIDSLSQSWSVLSGAVPEARSRKAMDALYDHLVEREPAPGFVRLLTPSFDKAPMDPGYIKGYIPGVRENGGQYTHAAVWAAMAFAAMDDGRRAWELARMINPVGLGDSPEAVAVYKVEPYVVAADVYANPSHRGRGGWSWYTGSAGWLYRLYVESLLGLRVEDGVLRLSPVWPAEWPEYRMRYRYRGTLYAIHARRAEGSETRLLLDGAAMDGDAVPLVDDGQTHTVEAELPASPPPDGERFFV